MSSERLWKFRLRHILEAIEKIERYTSSMSEEEFLADSLVIDAVIRNSQVIGEATRKVPADFKDAHPAIPWRDMERMRHVLVHDYERVMPEIVWRTIHKHLPPLVQPIPQLLEALAESDASSKPEMSVEEE